MSSRRPLHPISLLPAFDQDEPEFVNVIIETPKGSRNKFDFDPEIGLFILGSVMPAGAEFPFDFGFIPSTLGEDGDPLDIIVLTDEGTAAVPGCLVKVKLLGAIEAEQSEKGKKAERNDRLIGAAAKSREYQELNSLKEVPGQIVADIELFFRWYNQAKGGEFNALDHCGPKRARELVKEGMRKKKAA